MAYGSDCNGNTLGSTSNGITYSVQADGCINFDYTNAVPGTIDSVCFVICDTNNVCDTTEILLAIKPTLDTIITTNTDTCISVDELPLGYDTVTTCDGILSTDQGGAIGFINNCINYTPPAVWQQDTTCVIICDTTDFGVICDTTIVIFINPDTTINITCIDTTLYLDANGSIITVDTSFVLGSVSSTAGIDTAWLSTYTFDCSNVGTNSVTVSAQNTNNAINSCIATVTILDTIQPVILCNDTTIYLDLTGNFTIDTSLVVTSI